MFAECLSLSDTQYPILLALFITQALLYRKSPVYLRYSLALTLLLLVTYPVFFDTLPREGFSLMFTLLLLVLTGWMIYLATLGLREAVVIAVITGLYAVIFFVASSFLNAALFFTKPIDTAEEWYNKGSRFREKYLVQASDRPGTSLPKQSGNQTVNEQSRGTL